MKRKIAGKNDYIPDAETKCFPSLHFRIIPALFAAILPKCPLCLTAYASIFGIFRADTFLYGYWILPVTVAFSAITIILLYYQAKRSSKYFPFFLSLIAPIIILTGKFYLESNWLIYTGIAVLLISSVWLSISKKRQSDCNNCNCSQSGM